jgi:2-aminoadipate transaminase
MAKTLAHPELVSLAAGFVDHETLPVEPVRRAMERIWSDAELARSALQYGTTIGYPPLREAIVQRMLQADRSTAAATNLSASRLIVTAGSNQLLHLVGDALLDPGDVVLCGAPTYFVFLGTIENFGARAVGVEIDEQGLIPEAVDDRLARFEAAGELNRVKAIYVTTYYDNPSGITLPAGRREALVRLAERWSKAGPLYVIEDSAYRELRYHGDDVPSMRSFDPEGETVIETGSFSKSFSPGIRVGWGILPPGLHRAAMSLKGNLDFGSPNFNQVLMATVLEMGLFDPHVATLRKSYGEKIDSLLAAADEHLAPIDGIEWVRPGGGLYLWLRLPEAMETGLSSPLFEAAVKEGVLYVPGEHCYAERGVPVPRNMIRLSFGIQSCETIRQGMEALARAIRQVMR